MLRGVSGVGDMRSTLGPEAPLKRIKDFASRALRATPVDAPDASEKRSDVGRNAARIAAGRIEHRTIGVGFEVSERDV